MWEACVCDVVTDGRHFNSDLMFKIELIYLEESFVLFRFKHVLFDAIETMYPNWHRNID